LYWCLLGFDLSNGWLLINNWYKSRLDQMFTTLASDQSCEIDFQSMFMKVIWSTLDYLSTADTNLRLIRCLQHWHLVSLESKITLKFLVICCIKILAWHWHNSCCTGIVLPQLLGLALKVDSLGFNLDFLDVCHWGVGPTCQWMIIRWMTPRMNGDDGAFIPLTLI
jgi:hypothetical protein